MILLKDIRFYLIIGLAILCLIALKTCSTAEGKVSAVDDLSESKGTIAQIATESQQLVEEVGQKVESAAEKVEAVVEEVQAAVTSNDEVAVSAEINQAVESTVAVTESDDSDQSATPAVADAQADTMTGADAEASPAVVPEALVEQTSAVSDSGSDTTNVQAEIAVMPPVEVKKIVLRDPAGSGSDVADLKADISSLENGMYQYSEKAKRVNSLMDKLKGIRQ